MSEEWSFEKDDFLTTTPYEALYAYHKEPFTHAAKMEELAAYSVSKGFKGFKTMYKKYVESLKAQSGTIYIDNVTNFTNQPLELNAGDWEADDSGIFKKNGYNDEVAVTSQNAKAFIQYISVMENLNYDLIPEKKSI